MHSAPAQLVLAQAAPSGFEQMIPLVLILGVFYFLLIRPQQQQAKEHDAFVAGLKVGECVVTSSGLIGYIVKVQEKEVSLELAKGLVVRHDRSKIAARAGESAKAGKEG